MTVNNQEDFSLRMTEQLTQELDEYVASKSLCENRERELASVRNGRNHVAAKPLSCPRDNGRSTLYPVGASRLMVASQAHLVSPVNLRLFETCL